MTLIKLPVATDERALANHFFTLSIYSKDQQGYLGIVQISNAENWVVNSLKRESGSH